jgi:hypothetical protein
MTKKSGEFKLGHNSEPPVSFEGLVHTFEEWALDPWHDDAGLAAFSKFFIAALPPNINDIFERGTELFYENADEDGKLSPEDEFMLMVANYVDPETQSTWYIDTATSATNSYKGRKLYHAVRYVRFMMNKAPLMEKYFTHVGEEIPVLKHKYPEDFDKPEAFHELVTTIMEHPALGDLLTWALELFRIRTTVISRYLIPKLELQKEFGEQPIRIGSVGIGAGSGEKALLANIAFDDIEAIDPAYDPAGEPVIDTAMTQDVNQQKNAPLNIKEVLGFDVLANDEAQNTWMEASLLWQEHMDKHLMQTYKAMGELNDERFKQYRLDFTDDGKVDEFLYEYRRAHGGTPSQQEIDDFTEDYQRQFNQPLPEEALHEFLEKYSWQHGDMPNLDAFLAVTMIYQLKTQQERDAVYANMAKFVRKDGFILVQDSTDGSFGADFNYVTIKSYPHYPEVAPAVVAQSRDDRCHQIIIRSAQD